MMGYVLAVGLAVIAFGALAVLLKLPRKGWEAAGAALLLGLAGYALQGNPSEAGAPKAPVQKIAGNSAVAAIEARQQLSGNVPMSDKFLVTADALSRNGQFADAAGYLRGAVQADPANGEAWLAMANALFAHADRTLTPASLFAYRRASLAAPGNPAPPFFLGLALAESGRLDEGRALWADLLVRSAPDAPWRGDLVARLAELDAFIARQRGAAIAP